MTGQEARDEALEQAVEAQFPHHEVRPYAVRHFTAGFLASARKHPAPDAVDTELASLRETCRILGDLSRELSGAMQDMAARHPEPEVTDELRRLSDAARPGPWKAYETMQADNFIVEESQGLLRGPGPVMGPSYDKSTVEYVVALVNAHRAGWTPPEPEATDDPGWEYGVMSRWGGYRPALNLAHARALSESDVRYQGWTVARHRKAGPWVPVGEGEQ